MLWIAWTVFLLIFYLLSSGAAFVATYRYPERAPTRFFGWIFSPLDWLARNSLLFQRLYNRFHSWCYRKFVTEK